MATAPTELDFTKDPEGAVAAPAPQVIPYDPAPVREYMRGAITLVLLGTLFLVLVAGFGSLWGHVDSDQLMKLLTLVFAPLVALVGTSLGFYFGGQSHERGR